MGHPRTVYLAAFLSLTTAAIVTPALTGCSGTPMQATTGADWVITEARANTFTDNRQTRPTVASTADGGMVVAWASRRQEDGAFGVYAQRLDAVGRPMGPEIHVNQQTRGAQDEPAIGVSPSGDVWIVWSSTHTDGDARAIMARRFTLTGSSIEPRSDAFTLNTTASGDQASPSIAMGPDAGVLVTWTQTVGGAPAAIIARSFSVTGEPRSGEIALSSSISTADRAASVAPLSDGYAVVWTQHDPSTDAWTLLARRTDLMGRPAGAPAPVAPSADRVLVEPAVTTDGADVVTIAWMQRGADADSYGVFARRFNSALTPVTDSFEVATEAGARRSGAAVVAASDGRFAVLWNEEGAKVASPIPGKRPTRQSEIMAQRFDIHARPLGEPFVVNSTLENRQAMTIGAVAPRAVWTDRDQLITVWHGATTGDSRGVGVSIANPPSIAALAQTTPAPWSPDAGTVSQAVAAPPVFDPNFVPQPRDVATRGVGPDFGFLGIPATGWTPPDPDIAVGPTHVVAVANGAISWFTKDGTFQSQQMIEGSTGFWGAQGAQGFVFDPVALYDVHSHRFVVAAVERDSNDVSFIVLAISNTTDPNDGWVKHRQNVEVIGQGIDFPNLGVDENAVYVSVDFFDPVIGASVFAYDKADLIAGTLSGQVTQMAGGPVVTAGVYDYDTGNPNYYTLTAFNSSSTQLRLQAIVDPLGGHNLSTFFLTVPFFTNPPDAPQAGSSNLVSTIDIRIKHGVYRNGSLWCAHAVNDGGVARVRWYEIQMNGWPQSGQNPTLRQTGDIDPGPGVATWFPDISVDNAGNAAIAYNRSSNSEFVGIARAVRKAGDPLGQFRPSVVDQQSSSPELGDRWGDYSGVHEDPANPGEFWSHLEYRTSFWNTWVSMFSAVNANPANFSLLSPANNMVLATTTPTFSWEPALDADSYTIIIASDPALNVVVHQQAGIVGTSYTPPMGALDCASQFYWGVLAENAGGASVSTPITMTFTASLLGDVSNDGVVDTADLGGLIGAFGSNGPFGDINGDGVVDTADLGLLLSVFGDTCN